MPDPTNQGKSGQRNRCQGCSQKYVHLPLNAIVNVNNALPCLLFAFTVLDKQSSHCGAPAALPCLQLKLYLLTRGFLLPIVRESENAIHCIPELRHLSAEVGPLIRRA